MRARGGQAEFQVNLKLGLTPMTSDLTPMTSDLTPMTSSA